MASTPTERKASRDYYYRHRERILAETRAQRKTPEWREKLRLRRQKQRPKLREYERTVSEALRQQVLTLFGSCCARCGFNEDTRILQIDHINGNGNKERRAIGVRGIRRKALDNSAEYQLLCPNCNWRKRYDLNEHNLRKETT